MNHDGPRGATVSPRVALLSIICFWLVYFAVATIRSFMIDWGHQTEMMAARAFVTIGAMLATYIVYLAMRPLAGKSLAVNVTAVALLAAPAAVAYSSMNWMAFQQVDKKIRAEKDAAKYGVDGKNADVGGEQAKAAVEAARQAIREAVRKANEEAQARYEAQREAIAARQDAELRKADERRKAAETQRQRETAAASRENEQDRREAEQAVREALREAEQARREAIREAYQAQRDAYREAVSTYRESVQDAQVAANEAKRAGVTIDIAGILASIPPPPPPPVPPAIGAPRITIPTVPGAPPAPPAPQPAAPSPRIAPPPVVAAVPPAPIEIPEPVVSEPTPGTVLIQVGRPADPHKEGELSVMAQIGDQALNGYFFFAAWGALFLALGYAAAVRAAEREAAGYRAAARDAELRALRYQVNPHFLFNTLNSLSSLILRDRRDDAEAMILNLSTFFRTSLTADPAEDVVLSEEIRLQRLYLDIEQIRFPERLKVEIAVPDGLADACVPALILQPLVENAIKYGVSRAKRPVTIRISAREDSQGLVLAVEDDGDPLPGDGSERGTGVGLKNVADRLKARYGEDAACRYGPLPNGGFGVTLFMPLIRNGA